jgi:tetratricopeptide (TPR) repeat protein
MFPRTRSEASPAASAGETAKPDNRTLIRESDELVRKHEYAKALPLLEKLHADFPDNHIYIFRLTEVYRELGAYQKEAAAWERYLDVAPNPDTACPEIADAYRKAGNASEAMRALQRCVTIDPGGDNMLNLARAYERAGDRDKAIEWYTKGVAESPDYSDVRLGLARMQLRGGDLKSAKANVQKVLAKSPDTADALLLAGLIARREGESAAARMYFERGVAVSPTYADLQRELARLAEKQGDIAVAVRAWRAVLDREPGDTEAASAVRRMGGRA